MGDGSGGISTVGDGRATASVGVGLGETGSGAPGEGVGAAVRGTEVEATRVLVGRGVSAPSRGVGLFRGVEVAARVDAGRGVPPGSGAPGSVSHATPSPSLSRWCGSPPPAPSKKVCAADQLEKSRQSRSVGPMCSACATPATKSRQAKAISKRVTRALAASDQGV
jgi:hypothetical protein